MFSIIKRFLAFNKVKKEYDTQKLGFKKIITLKEFTFLHMCYFTIRHNKKSTQEQIKYAENVEKLSVSYIKYASKLGDDLPAMTFTEYCSSHGFPIAKGVL
ncbi:hypothetical protein P6A00_001638 [Vibrio parahaemolyticus]|uniref:hypothetical protein n=1 Tax=Vibrio parahaemolyticus TaxID=670 RepID=UPI001A33C207|nr:hypothetical protein [Vibrio parahaemolyticus]EGQ7798834.1 hypothetical protein [Vibrio parahaemolyticus]EGQ8110535.1 hypothetical protein [Vibrio parahaemolyticus]EGQ8198422.1 hypothetical protein [Vibrio parahaemolyticus]EGU0149854.1 hypothetical protein [Vibrio parahaemolyticus]EKQ5912414.1 hypothetical protein [Vibrio parahaemolyticus]